ncbi:L-threonine 3-dehydrogenase [Candidatus Micrarchaeota archaeon]|nr:L-threonine 3-dehydrogenase [Candidatus Micrarchaeota archaeon]MBU1681613.1 L-threonine 3-dehydrogenase [Candidatus Micrarchaeota archaeon]
MNTMTAIWKTEPKQGFEIKDAQIPKIKDDEVLIKVKATSICGTDLHIYNWDAWSASRIGKNLPYIFGHEVSGEVVEVGKDAKGVSIGDHVSAETHIACNYCYQCRTGNSHICENVEILGVDRNGTFAEYLSLPARNAWVNDKSIPHHIATAQEPLGNAVHTVFNGEIAAKTVAIFGMGPIGVCGVRLCKLAGAEKVIAVDMNETRLKFAKDFGADVIINGSAEGVDVRKEIMDATNGAGADVFLEMAGSPGAMQDGLATLRPGGRASILGVFSKPFEIDVTNDIVFKGIQLNGVNGRKMFDSWYKSKSFLPKMNLEKLVTHKFKLTEIEKGFDVLLNHDGMKVVLEP